MTCWVMPWYRILLSSVTRFIYLYSCKLRVLYRNSIELFWGWKSSGRLKDWPRDLTSHNYLSFQVFREDFTLCLMLGDFLSDPILSDSPDLTLSIYGDSDQFRTARLSAMHLHLAEGHVLGQVSASLRGPDRIQPKTSLFIHPSFPTANIH